MRHWFAETPSASTAESIRIPESSLSRATPAMAECISGKVFVFPTGKGSTVGSYVIYRMKKQGTAPAAIINVETEAILATGCVISSIPLVDKLEGDPLKTLKTGMRLRVVGDKGLVEVYLTPFEGQPIYRLTSL